MVDGSEAYAAAVYWTGCFLLLWHLQLPCCSLLLRQGQACEGSRLSLVKLRPGTCRMADQLPRWLQTGTCMAIATPERRGRSDTFFPSNNMTYSRSPLIADRGPNAAVTDMQMWEPGAPIAFPNPPDWKATLHPSAWAC